MKIKPAILREAMSARQGPVLLYDVEVIEANMRFYKKTAEEQGASWSMAVKALARSEALAIASDYTDGFDISNIEEWKKIGPFVKEHEIWLTNGNLREELAFFAAQVPPERLVVTLNDSFDYALIKGKGINYAVRVCSNDLVELKGTSRFGWRVADILARKDELLHDDCFVGFHVHQGLEEHTYSILHSMLGSIEKKLQAFAGKDLRFNLGGSLQGFSAAELALALKRLSPAYRAHIEPGRALFQGAGHALVPVEKFLFESGKLRIFTRLSFTAHLKWSKAVFAGIINLGNELETFRPSEIVLEGPTCYEFDSSGAASVSEEIALGVGSLVVLNGIAGYSAEWNTSFNGVLEAEVKFIGRRR